MIISDPRSVDHLTNYTYSNSANKVLCYGTTYTSSHKYTYRMDFFDNLENSDKKLIVLLNLNFSYSLISKTNFSLFLNYIFRDRHSF